MRRKRYEERDRAVAEADGWLDDLRGTLDTSWARLSREVAPLDEDGSKLAVCAPNAIEWICGSEWCNVPETYEYWGEYQLVRDYFELRCPICNSGTDDRVWGKSRMELEDEVLLRWQEDYFDDVCPKCGTCRAEFLEDGLFRGYNSLVLLAGQRSGKSICGGLIGTYVEHRICTLGLNGGFHAALDIVPTERFEVTFLASTDEQSADTIWAKYVGFRAESPWFQRYVPWVKEQERAQTVPEGMKPWFYRENEKRIVNMHPSVRLICNSQNSNSPALRGKTRPAGFIDEISHMEQTESKRSAGAIYRAIERSLRTVRSRVKLTGAPSWLGSVFASSSPVSRNDKGMQLVRDAKKVKTAFAVHKTTWDFNPKEPRSGLEAEFAVDPIGAMTDYGAQPPGSEYPLIHDESRWRGIVLRKPLMTRAKFELYERQAPTGQTYVAARLRAHDFIRDGIPRFVVWDAGQNWDAFAGVCGHGEWWTDPNGGDDIWTTVYDWIVRILPRSGTEVYFDSVVDIMREVKKSMKVAMCEFDRWQSTSLIQSVRELGVFSQPRSTKDADYVQFKIDSFAGRVAMLEPLATEYDQSPDVGIFDWLVNPAAMTPPAVALYEVLGTQCDPDTHKMSWPHKGETRGEGSNDVAQGIVHVNMLVQKQARGYTDKHDGRSREDARVRLEASAKDWERRGGLASPSKFGRSGGGSGGNLGGSSGGGGQRGGRGW